MSGNDFFKPAWPFGLGSCPKVDHHADSADRVPEGSQRIQSRAHVATGLDPERPSSNISDSEFAERQPPSFSRRAGPQGVRQQTFQLGAKDSAGIQTRGVNKWLSMQPASVQFLLLKRSPPPSQSCSPKSVGGFFLS